MADTNLGRLIYKIVGDTSQLDKSVKKSDTEVKGLGKTLSNIGKLVKGAAVTGAFIAFGKAIVDTTKKAIDAFRVQEDAEAKLNQTLEATGFAAGLTSDELKKLASGLQDVTRFGDEAIIGAESLLLTFKDIGEDTFPRALKSILDVSEAMGQDLQSSTIQIGKALNDPVAGLSALTRVGIQFTEEQKNLIKSFDEAGDKASAQAVILKELESQFGGVAEAVALTSKGVDEQLNNAYGDLLETIGGVIDKGMKPYKASLIEEIQKVNESIQAHILRKKAINGEATTVENLTLKQYELKKINEEIAQAELNIKNATEQQLDTSKLSEQQILRIEAGKQAAIERAKELVQELENEKNATERQVEALQRAVTEQQAALQANIDLATGVKTVTDNTEEGNDANEESNELAEDKIELTDEQIEANARLLDSLLEEEAIRDRNRRLIEAEAEAQEDYNRTVADFEQALADAEVTAQFLAESVLNSLGGAFVGLGEAIAGGELSFKDFGKLALQVLADVLRSLGSQLAAQAALLFFGLIPDIPRGTAALAASAAALTASGVASGLANSFENGGIVPGTSYTGDNVIANVNSGEMILNKEQQAALFNMANSGGGGSQTIIVKLNENVILETVNKGSRTGKLTLDARSF